MGGWACDWKEDRLARDSRAEAVPRPCGDHCDIGLPGGAVWRVRVRVRVEE